MQTAHVAAAMTYTLAFLLAVLLARSGSSGRAAWIEDADRGRHHAGPAVRPRRLRPDLSVGHIGTSVPLLLIWLLLDRAPARWYVPVLTALLLAWVLVADPIVLRGRDRAAGAGLRGRGCCGAWPAGTGPLDQPDRRGVVRAVPGRRGGGRGRPGLDAQQLLRALGGFVVNPLPFYFVTPATCTRTAPAAWKVPADLRRELRRARRCPARPGVPAPGQRARGRLGAGPARGMALLRRRQPGRPGAGRGDRRQRGALPADQRRGPGPRTRSPSSCRSARRWPPGC